MRNLHVPECRRHTRHHLTPLFTQPFGNRGDCLAVLISEGSQGYGADAEGFIKVLTEVPVQDRD